MARVCDCIGTSCFTGCKPGGVAAHVPQWHCLCYKNRTRGGVNEQHKPCFPPAASPHSLLPGLPRRKGRRSAVPGVVPGRDHGGGRRAGGRLRALPAGLPAQGQPAAAGWARGRGARGRALSPEPSRAAWLAGAVLREALPLPPVPRRRRGAPARPLPRGRGAVQPLPPAAEGGRRGGAGREGKGRGGGRRHGGGRGGGRRRHLEPRTSAPLPPVWRPPQAQQRCEGCQSLFGEYYCGVCHLFDRDKKQYHCDDCGICRCDAHRLLGSGCGGGVGGWGAAADPLLVSSGSARRRISSTARNATCA